MKKKIFFEGVSLPEPKVLNSIIWDTAIVPNDTKKKVEPVGFFF